METAKRNPRPGTKLSVGARTICREKFPDSYVWNWYDKEALELSDEAAATGNGVMADNVRP
jgi:hypothetical protein